MAQSQQRTVQVKQRRFAPGLNQREGVHRPPLFGFGKRFQRQAGEINLLVGTGIEFVGHDGSLHNEIIASRRSDSVVDHLSFPQAQNKRPHENPWVVMRPFAYSLLSLG